MQQPAACAMAGADLELGRLLVLANLHAGLQRAPNPQPCDGWSKSGGVPGMDVRRDSLREDRDGRLLSSALV